VDIIQIKSWFGELAEDKKEHKMNQAQTAKIKQENKEAINNLALKYDAIIDWDKKLFYSSSSDRSRAVSRFFCAAAKPGRILIASLK